MATWDRHAIKAQVHRQGATLEQLALDADLASAACRIALREPQLGGEIAIATFLGVDPAELWPGRYRAPMSEGRSRALDEFRASRDASSSTTSSTDDRNISPSNSEAA